MEELEKLALKVREHIIGMTKGGGCFIGASLSCVELITFLYYKHLRINKEDLKNENRDYLFLSKGHDVPALYATLAELGYISTDRLLNHLQTKDAIYWHPNTKIPGVEFHSGSLGHLPAVAAGVAIDLKIKHLDNRVIVITGDGELNEGSIWECLLVANAYQLDNLTILVDRNQFQANIRTEDLIPLEPLEDKFLAFGCAVQRVNGHNYEELETAFEKTKIPNKKVQVIIADTIRGKGLPSIEARADRWFCTFSEEEIKELLNELHGQHQAVLHSETLMVR